MTVDEVCRRTGMTEAQVIEELRHCPRTMVALFDDHWGLYFWSRREMSAEQIRSANILPGIQ